MKLPQGSDYHGNGEYYSKKKDKQYKCFNSKCNNTTPRPGTIVCDKCSCVMIEE